MANDLTTTRSKNGVATTTGSIQTQVSTAQKEAELQYEIAHRFPRNEGDAKANLLEVCCNVPLAEKSLYCFSRGGNLIEGPSIHLVDEAVRFWGRIRRGWQIMNPNFLEDRYVEIRCFAIDLQTIAIQERTILVPLGEKQRDFDGAYYHAANYAERRTRTLCEKLLPDDLLADAVIQVKETLKSANDVPLQQRIKSMLEGFEKRFQVTRAQIEKRMQRKAEALTESQMVTLKAMFQSLKDGAATVDQFFEVPTVEAVVTDVTPAKETKKKAAGTKKDKAPAPQEETQAATPAADEQLKVDAIVAAPGEEPEEEAEGEQASEEEPPEEQSTAWGFGE